MAIVSVGIDLAKIVFAVHGVHESGKHALVRTSVSRAKPLELIASLSSGGGKNHLGGIMRRGDMYLRTLLIRGANLVVWSAHKRDDPISRWVHGLREKHGWQKAAVALTNKNTRILWAVMTKGQAFDARRISVKPT